MRWVLEYRAGVSASDPTEIPSGVRLNGILGHRLVERLYRAGELPSTPEAVEARARVQFDVLVAEEGTPLLLSGMAAELAQLRVQLVAAVKSFAGVLAASRLEIVAVEQTDEVDWRGGKLWGRTDLLLRDEHGTEVIVDLKWGRGKYRTLLEKGSALQLAAYSFLRKKARGTRSFPAVAYFSIGQKTFLTTEQQPFVDVRRIDGSSAANTWQRIEATAARIERLLQTGQVPVAGLSRSLPVVQAAGGNPSDADAFVLEPDAACKYCSYDAVCGRRWERPS
jgi:hypothetical protein